ncbi:hypothetical protein G6F32_016463 [Rhizopus arrhizus]|nr:hypothetical protein G6F32_016463 [Rhizopus arrhizus]
MVTPIERWLFSLAAVNDAGYHPAIPWRNDSAPRYPQAQESILMSDKEKNTGAPSAATTDAESPPRHAHAGSHADAHSRAGSDPAVACQREDGGRDLCREP